MNVKSFKNLNERNFKLESFSVLIADKQQIFWKKSSRIFIIFLSLLKFLRAFEIISCSFIDLWFIIQSALHDLTTIIQLQNILIYFIRTAIFRNIFYVLTVTKEKSHIIEDVIAISCNFTFSSLSVETKCIFFFRNARKDNVTNIVFSKINKNVKIKSNDQFLWWRVQVFECSTMMNHVLILDWQWIFQYFRSWWICECLVIHSFRYVFYFDLTLSCIY